MAMTTNFPDKYSVKSIVCSDKTFEFGEDVSLEIVNTVRGATELRYKARYKSFPNVFLDVYNFLLSNKNLEYDVYMSDEKLLTFKAPYDVDCRIAEISLYDEYYLANTLTIIIYGE